MLEACGLSLIPGPAVTSRSRMLATGPGISAGALLFKLTLIPDLCSMRINRPTKIRDQASWCAGGIGPKFAVGVSIYQYRTPSSLDLCYRVSTPTIH
jgi:hypothetical protein